MEIGYQGIDDVERKSRIDENVGPAGAGLQSPCRPGAFQGADGCRTDGNDAPSFSFSLINRSCRFGRNAVKFAVHLMVFNIFFFYRAECSQSDVQGYKDFLYAFIPNFLQQFVCKMKACPVPVRTRSDIRWDLPFFHEYTAAAAFHRFYQ